MKKIINTFDFVPKKDSSKIDKSTDKDIKKSNEDVMKSNISFNSDKIKEMGEEEK